MFTLVLGLAMLLLASGCRTVPPLAPVNLKEPGWTIREGQAVWRMREGREIAGDILIATRSNGDAFVQFSKNPFPLIVAQSTPSTWQVEIPTHNKRYSGRGQPPKRLFWLYLPRILSGHLPPKDWTWNGSTEQWTLLNPNTRESLQGYLTQ